MELEYVAIEQMKAATMHGPKQVRLCHIHTKFLSS